MRTEHERYLAYLQGTLPSRRYRTQYRLSLWAKILRGLTTGTWTMRSW